MASRCGVIQLRLTRHQTYQEGEEFSLSKFAVRESHENEPTDDAILVELLAAEDVPPHWAISYTSDYINQT